MRKPLVARGYSIDLESKVGKVQVIAPGTPLSQQAGYYCDVCNCVVKDSANYLDHINGKKRTFCLTEIFTLKHFVADQRALGFSLRPERSTLDQVREKFKLGKRKKEEEDSYSILYSPPTKTFIHLIYNIAP
jgi:U4/U6.U5 tri-snRNP component SNU23